MNDKTSIAIRFDTGSGHIFYRFGRKKKLQQFITQPDSETYLCRQFADGTERLERAMTANEVGRLGDADILAQIMTNVFVAELTYSGMTSSDGTDFDLTVVATWRITKARTFLREYGLDCLKSADSVSIILLESMLAQRCRQQITDEICTVTYDALNNQDALPAKWWRTKLSQWIDLGWLELIEVKDVRYESVTADKEAEIKKRRELQQLEEAEREQQYGHEIRLQHQQTEFENARRELEVASELSEELSEQERQVRLDQVQLERDKAVLQDREDIEIIKLEAKKKKAGLEADIARLRHRADEAEVILRQAQQAEQRNKELLETIRKAQSERAEAAEVAKFAIQEGLAGGERISSSAAGVSSATMSLLGKDSGPAYLAQVFREKASASPDSVIMRKVELRTRDIGTKKVDELAINSSLQFEFLSQRAGYATILNIGTSGNVWLQSPNAYVGIEQAGIESGRKYQIPGQLLPPEELSRHGLAYLEVGPPGWEELIVIVSDKPLVTDSDIISLNTRQSFRGIIHRPYRSTPWSVGRAF